MLLITGSNGQLGSELNRIYPRTEAYFASHNEFDITHIGAIEEFIQKYNISGIINCAAYTAVDKAETDQDLCFKVNVEGVANLARIASQLDIAMIHISTDYVFSGTNFLPYKETDKIDPKSIYGTSKAKGEEAFLKYANQGIVIRTSWLYSEFGSNFLKTILKLGNERPELNIIFDQIGTPTYAYDLAKALHKIMPEIKKSEKEIYHFSNEGIASWYDFAYEIINLQKLNCIINPIETKDYPLPAKRPLYSVLNKAKIKEKYDIKIRHWKEALSECIQNIS